MRDPPHRRVGLPSLPPLAKPQGTQVSLPRQAEHPELKLIFQQEVHLFHPKLSPVATNGNVLKVIKGDVLVLRAPETDGKGNPLAVGIWCRRARRSDRYLIGIVSKFRQRGMYPSRAAQKPVINERVLSVESEKILNPKRPKVVWPNLRARHENPIVLWQSRCSVEETDVEVDRGIVRAEVPRREAIATPMWR